jgi:hypothetical protein
VNQDSLLLGWLRRYAGLLIACTVVGLAIGVAYVKLAPRQVGASALVIERGFKVPYGQLSSVATAVFRSRAVYQPALRSLGTATPPSVFVAEHTDISPVAGTNTIVVIGKDKTLKGAESIANAFARSLVGAFDNKFKAHSFILFDKAQPASVALTLSTKVALTLAMLIGLWIGIGTALIAYRSSRPVLTVDRAMILLGVDFGLVVDTRRRGIRLPGFLRRSSARHKEVTITDLPPSATLGSLHRYGEPVLSSRHLTDGEHPRTEHRSTEENRLYVWAHPWTPELELRRTGRYLELADHPVELIWCKHSLNRGSQRPLAGGLPTT